MPNVKNITVIIPAYNEENRIGRCIRSCRFMACRIIVMDNMSTDTTCELAESLGAEVIRSEKPYKERLVWAINKDDITTDWILYIDADEEITPGAAKEITAFCQDHSNDNVNGLVCRYVKMFMGKALLHSGSHEYKMRLFKKGTAVFETNVELDEHMVLTNGKSLPMKNHILHYSYTGIDQMITKLNGFARRKAEELIRFETGQSEVSYDGLADVSKQRRHIQYDVYFKLPISIRARLLYWFTLWFRGGILDGSEGRTYLFFRVYWYRKLIDAYYLELKKEQKN